LERHFKSDQGESGNFFLFGFEFMGGRFCGMELGEGFMELDEAVPPLIEAFWLPSDDGSMGEGSGADCGGRSFLLALARLRAVADKTRAPMANAIIPRRI